MRVETLERTAADHESRISDTESDVKGKNILVVENDNFLLAHNLKIFVRVKVSYYFQISKPD